jgi:prepilin-type processing-associated H-X9-DG protein
MHNYHDTHKTFPPAALKNKDGTPMVSWRTCILPYVELYELYDEFDFDQPWDSEHNLEVASRIPPDVFQCPSNPHGSGEDGFQYKEIKGYKIPVSHYVMVTGPNTVGGEGEGTVMSEITDGTSNTILFVEIRGANAPAVTEPVDLTLEELKRGINSQDVSGLGSYHPGGMNAALCDGSVHFFSESTDPGTLEALATINDGNRVSIE